MGSKSKSSTASSTNITTTTTNQNAIAGAGATSVIAGDGFQGDIGLTGFTALQAVQSFNERAMQQDLLSAQNTANALALSGGGGGSVPIYLASNNSNEPAEKVESNTSDVQRLALVLGGVAAVATVITLTRK